MYRATFIHSVFDAVCRIKHDAFLGRVSDCDQIQQLVLIAKAQQGFERGSVYRPQPAGGKPRIHCTQQDILNCRAGVRLKLVFDCSIAENGDICRRRILWGGIPIRQVSCPFDMGKNLFF